MADADNSTERDEEFKTLLLSIGYVAVQWAELEYQINRAIWALSSMSDKDGACITSHIGSIIPRMRALMALANQAGCSKRLTSDLNKFSAEADGLSRRRNRIIHDPWLYKKETTEFARLEITADRKLIFEVKPHAVEEVAEVGHQISTAIETFRNLRGRMHEDLTARAKGLIQEHVGKDAADFLDRLNPDNEHEKPQPPPEPSQG